MPLRIPDASRCNLPFSTTAVSLLLFQVHEAVRSRVISELDSTRLPRGRADTISTSRSVLGNGAIRAHASKPRAMLCIQSPPKLLPCRLHHRIALIRCHVRRPRDINVHCDRGFTWEAFVSPYLPSQLCLLPTRSGRSICYRPRSAHAVLLPTPLSRQNCLHTLTFFHPPPGRCPEVGRQCTNRYSEAMGGERQEVEEHTK